MKTLSWCSLFLPYEKIFFPLLKMESDNKVLQSEILCGRTGSLRTAFSSPEASFAYVIYLPFLLYLPEPCSCIFFAVCYFLVCKKRGLIWISEVISTVMLFFQGRKEGRCEMYTYTYTYIKTSDKLYRLTIFFATAKLVNFNFNVYHKSWHSFTEQPLASPVLLKGKEKREKRERKSRGENLCSLTGKFSVAKLSHWSLSVWLGTDLRTRRNSLFSADYIRIPLTACCLLHIAACIPL